MTVSFTADRIDLGSAIARAAQGLPSRPAQPVYAGLLFAVDAGIVHITGSDGDVTFISSLPAIADDDPGSFILPGKVVTEVFKYLAGGKEIAVAFDGDRAEILAGRSRYAFPAVDGEKYPAWLPPSKYLGALDGAEFAAAVRSVVPAAARGGASAVFRTLCLTPDADALRIVATDSYRMAMMSPSWKPFLTEDDPPGQVLVPSWVMERFARIVDEEVAIGWDQALVTMATQGLQVTARTIAGKYPPWEKIILREPPGLSATCAVPELTRAVRAAALIAGSDPLGTSGHVELEFSKDGHLHVRSRGDGTCDEMTGTDYYGETARFVLGSQMLLDGLAGCDEEVIFSFTADPLGPVFVRDGDFRYFMKPRAELYEEQGDQSAVQGGS